MTPYSTWKITCVLSAVGGTLPSPAQPAFLTLLALHGPLFALGVFNIKSQFFGKAFIANSNKQDSVALTFDDGPDSRLTPEVLDLLEEYNLKATFFVVADRIKNNEAIVERIVEEGHTIACHDLTHGLASNFRRTKQLIEDITTAREIIFGAVGKKPLLYRPPVGLMNPHVPVALKKLGMNCIGWSRSAGDAGNRRPKRIQNISKLPWPGSVIMVHDCLPIPELKDKVLRQMRGLCETVVSQDLNAVGIEEMFGIPAYANQEIVA